MAPRPTGEIVLLDLNTLGWLYRQSDTTPKSFDLETEKEALRSLGRLTDPPVHFRYPDGHFREHYSDVIPHVRRDLPNFRLSIWATGRQFGKEFEWFEQRLRNKGEQQDDVELLGIAAFFESRRISRIATLDAHFRNRLPSLHGKIRRDAELLDWVVRNRRDFFGIKPMLPSELLRELASTESV